MVRQTENDIDKNKSKTSFVVIAPPEMYVGFKPTAYWTSNFVSAALLITWPWDFIVVRGLS